MLRTSSVILNSPFSKSKRQNGTGAGLLATQMYGNVPSFIDFANLSFPPHLFTIAAHFVASFSKDSQLTFAVFKIALDGSNFLRYRALCFVSAFPS